MYMYTKQQSDFLFQYALLLEGSPSSHRHMSHITPPSSHPLPVPLGGLWGWTRENEAVTHTTRGGQNTSAVETILG